MILLSNCQEPKLNASVRRDRLGGAVKARLGGGSNSNDSAGAPARRANNHKDNATGPCPVILMRSKSALTHQRLNVVRLARYLRGQQLTAFFGDQGIVLDPNADIVELARYVGRGLHINAGLNR